MRADTDDDWRIALHESGHAVVAVDLGRTLGPVTIVGTEHYGGLTFHSSAEEIPSADMAFVGPLPLMPEALRREFEVGVCVSLAGAVAEELRWADDPPSRPHRPPTPLRHEWRSPADSLPELSSADEAAIAQAQRPLTNDAEDAWRAALAFVGTSSSPEVTAGFIRYCEAVTRDLVGQRRDAVTRLADALLAHRTLSGEAATTIIEGEAVPVRPTRPPEDPPCAAAPDPGTSEPHP